MNAKLFPTLLFAAVVAAGIAREPARANKPVFGTVSGNVTVAPSGGQITVDGRTYRIQPGSSAAAQAPGVLAGDSVQLKLSGPPNSSSTTVVAIHATHSR